jgi:hypothetical protein
VLLHGGQQGGPVLQDGSRKKVSLCFLLPFLQIFDDYANDDGVLDGIASIKSSLLILGLDDEEVDQVCVLAGFEVFFLFFFFVVETCNSLCRIKGPRGALCNVV